MSVCLSSFDHVYSYYRTISHITVGAKDYRYATPFHSVKPSLRSPISTGSDRDIRELAFDGLHRRTGVETRPAVQLSGRPPSQTRGRPVLTLSKVGDIPIVYHRDVPADATIKEIVVKQERTGEWFAVLGIETENDAPPKPEHP
jgi:hypothetical protein